MTRRADPSSPRHGQPRHQEGLERGFIVEHEPRWQRVCPTTKLRGRIVAPHPDQILFRRHQHKAFAISFSAQRLGLARRKAMMIGE